MDEIRLVRLALRCGAADVGGPLTDAERHLIHLAWDAPPPSDHELHAVRAAIRAGDDPLGDYLCSIRPAGVRRRQGSFFTPSTLVEPMLDWVFGQAPHRFVDPGCGSGRFAAAIVRRDPTRTVVAVDIDPVATILARAALAVLGASDATVLHADYLALTLPPIGGRTAFVGNPPYVRHHDLARDTKARASTLGRMLGQHVSGLAGLHALFYLATALHAAEGDVGCFVTSSEWLDVGYGSLIRELLLDGLGGRALHVISPQATPFADAMTTAAIACFLIGAQPARMRLRLVETADELTDLGAGREVEREVLAGTRRWTPLFRALPATRSEQLIPLRQIARVHRGVVTGANAFFILSRERAEGLGLARWCRPAITRAEEVFRSGGVLRDGPERRLLLDAPADVARHEHPALDAYLRLGEASAGGQPSISHRYIASRRRPWWRLGVPPPPPIVVSYMARQAPVFALNPDRLAVVNIAHGLYPLRPLSPEQLSALVAYLNEARNSFRGSGRTYHGGLEKFEPGELEALPIPANGPWSG